MRSLFRHAACCAWLVLGVGACAGDGLVGVGGSNTGGTGAINQAEYDIQLKKWQANAPAHYRIVYQQTCECATDLQRPTRVTARRVDGQDSIEEVLDAQRLEQVSLDRKAAAKSVDGLFTLISQGLALSPQEYRVTYDPTLGYPLSINIDPVTSISGDEIVYKVTSFETIP